MSETLQDIDVGADFLNKTSKGQTNCTTTIFIRVLLTIAKIWNKLMYTLSDEWVKKM